MYTKMYMNVIAYELAYINCDCNFTIVRTETKNNL